MALPKNVGSIDKTIRLVAGLLLAAYALLGASIGSTIGIVALVAGVVLIVTGVVNFCPLFKILGISSFKAPSNT